MLDIDNPTLHAQMEQMVKSSADELVRQMQTFENNEKTILNGSSALLVSSLMSQEYMLKSLIFGQEILEKNIRLLKAELRRREVQDV